MPRQATALSERGSLLELPKQFRFPGPGTVDRYVGDPVGVGRKLDAILIQHSDVLPPETPIEESHLKDDVLAGARMKFVLGNSAYIVRREQDYGPARLGRMP